MRPTYHDILDRITEPPLWFDEYGVPRYVVFAPDHVPNVYATEAVLFLISCQQCNKESLVALSAWRNQNQKTLADQIETRSLRYGDPPGKRCCGAGSTMNSVTLRVLEYWTRLHKTNLKLKDDWRRDPNLEIGFAKKRRR